MASARVYIVYYSLHGHIRRMAEEIKKGIEKVPMVSATLYQVPETLPNEVLTKMHAVPKADHPVITPDELAKADGIIFGVPTRFGTPCAQIQQFMDSTGMLWKSGALVGKPAGVFTSSGSLGGGQETTGLTLIPNLVHHGMVFVSLGKFIAQ